MNNTTTNLGEIADIITGPFGSQLHMSDYVSEGMPVIMPQNIGNRTVIEDGIARITQSDFERLKRYATKENDLVFSRRGDVEKHAFISNSDGALCGTGCLRVRVKSDNVYPLYLSFYLSMPEKKKWLSTHAVGSNMPNLNTDILSALPIDLPDYEVQVKTTNSLQLIDNKIAINDKINDNLAA